MKACELPGWLEGPLRPGGKSHGCYCEITHRKDEPHQWYNSQYWIKWPVKDTVSKSLTHKRTKKKETKLQTYKQRLKQQIKDDKKLKQRLKRVSNGLVFSEPIKWIAHFSVTNQEKEYIPTDRRITMVYRLGRYKTEWGATRKAYKIETQFSTPLRTMRLDRVEFEKGGEKNERA